MIFIICDPFKPVSIIDVYFSHGRRHHWKWGYISSPLLKSGGYRGTKCSTGVFLCRFSLTGLTRPKTPREYKKIMIPNALFAVLFSNVFLVASAVASPMVRDAS